MTNACLTCRCTPYCLNHNGVQPHREQLTGAKLAYRRNPIENMKNRRNLLHLFTTEIKIHNQRNHQNSTPRLSESTLKPVVAAVIHISAHVALRKAIHVSLFGQPIVATGKPIMDCRIATRTSQDVDYGFSYSTTQTQSFAIRKNDL